MWLAPILPGLVGSRRLPAPGREEGAGRGGFGSSVAVTRLSSRPSSSPTNQNGHGLSGRHRSSLTHLTGTLRAGSSFSLRLGWLPRGVTGERRALGLPCGRRPSVPVGSAVPWPRPLCLFLLEATGHWTPALPPLWPQIRGSALTVLQISAPPAGSACHLGTWGWAFEPPLPQAWLMLGERERRQAGWGQVGPAPRQPDAWWRSAAGPSACV